MDIKPSTFYDCSSIFFCKNPLLDIFTNHFIWTSLYKNKGCYIYDLDFLQKSLTEMCHEIIKKYSDCLYTAIFDWITLLKLLGFVDGFSKKVFYSMKKLFFYQKFFHYLHTPVSHQKAAIWVCFNLLLLNHIIYYMNMIFLYKILGWFHCNWGF